MTDIMTENMFQEAKKHFENSLEKRFDFLHKPTKEALVRAFEDAIRDTVIVQVVAPHSFPAGLIHEDDYYGADEEGNKVEPKLDVTKGPTGWDGDC